MTALPDLAGRDVDSRPELVRHIASSWLGAYRPDWRLRLGFGASADRWPSTASSTRLAARRVGRILF